MHRQLKQDDVVVRGPNWAWKSQDVDHDGQQMTGVVVNKPSYSADGKKLVMLAGVPPLNVSVVWANGTRNTYAHYPKSGYMDIVHAQDACVNKFTE